MFSIYPWICTVEPNGGIFLVHPAANGTVVASFINTWPLSKVVMGSLRNHEAPDPFRHSRLPLDVLQYEGTEVRKRSLHHFLGNSQATCKKIIRTVYNKVLSCLRENDINNYSNFVCISHQIQDISAQM